ncbi:MAG: mycofactocin precursor MftA [Solirubrobacteraceae bacterium]
MTIQATTPQTTVPTDAPDSRRGADESVTGGGSEPALVLDELLVEDVSIDGMCGVY